MNYLKTKLLTILALILCMSIFYIPAYAGETMVVSAEWLDDYMLRIDVENAVGLNQSLALRLSDYISEAENSQYISIQAVDLDGNMSGVIQLLNPYYVPAVADEQEQLEYVAQSNPLTPDGSGTVIDNVTNENGVEFFTIFTEDGNEFFLIIDRQRSVDNVYLLNATTEEDLISLARQSGREIEAPGASDPPPPPVILPEIPQEQTPPPEPDPKPETGGGNSGIIIIIVAVLGFGGAAYYFKVIRAKNREADEDDEDDEYAREIPFDEQGEDDNSEDYYDDTDVDERGDVE